MHHGVSYRIRRIVSVFVALFSFALFIFLNPGSYQPAQSVEIAPTDAPPIELKATQEQIDSFLASDVLEKLAVQEKNTSEKYYRKLFYDNWGMTDSGCNVREAILARDMSDVVLNGCKVASGVLNDPYTGKIINFRRGQDTSSEVQIDHVVALSNAWATGAYAFDGDKRYEISQDPLNLIAVDGPANQEKSDQDASDWLPSNTAFRCEYVARQISVKYKYKLWVTPSEKTKMREVLSTCPEQSTLGLENL